MDVGRPGKSGACWRDQAEDKGFAGRIAPTCLCPSIGKQKMPTSKRTFEVGIFVFYSAPAELASSDSAFATPVALLLFCPVVAMLHPLHSPLASGANPFALFLGAVEWRFFEAYSPASGFITGKSCTSRMVVESVMSITRRSIPIPMPPVGGRPISSALT